jgi:hypothetical protein
MKKFLKHFLKFFGMILGAVIAIVTISLGGAIATMHLVSKYPRGFPAVLVVLGIAGVAVLLALNEK